MPDILRHDRDCSSKTRLPVWDAGRRSAWIASSCRHPKTCTDSEVPDFCDAIALHVRKSPKSRRYLSSAQGQIQRQNQLERPKSLPEVKMIDCTETATNLTQTVAIRL